MSGQTRVLIIGSGRRVQKQFLPAFHCLDRFVVSGIHSRTPARLDVVAQRWNIPAVYSLDTFDFSTVDVVVVVVSQGAVIEVLQKVQTAASALTLIIDTPVFAHLFDFRRITLLQRFKRVLVAEDYPTFPQFKLLGVAISRGLVGRVKHVHLLNAGWSYHGFALARKLLGYPPLLYLKTTRFHGEHGEVRFRFAGGTSATLVDPFDFAAGRILVAGDRGCVANYPLRNETAFHLETVREHDRPFYRIQIPGGEPLTYSPPLYSRAASYATDDYTLQKTLGLIDLLDEFFGNIDARYGYVEGLADHAFAKLAYRVGMFVDPLAFFGTTVFSAWDRTAALVSGRRAVVMNRHAA